MRGVHSRVAQWWSKKLLTSRLLVRVQSREPSEKTVRSFLLGSGVGESQHGSNRAVGLALIFFVAEEEVFLFLLLTPGAEEYFGICER